MVSMTMKNRERGITNARGKHNALLGRWFKKYTSITLIASVGKGKVLGRGSIVSFHQDNIQCLVFGHGKTIIESDVFLQKVMI